MGGRLFIATWLACGWLVGLSGCSLILPTITHEPVIRNPFPQLSSVAIAPFFNQSDDPTVDGRQFAMGYFSELQKTPGFEVVPVTVTEEAIVAHRVDLSGPGEARRLAKILGVDAVVVGAVTDFTPYYPPRCGLRVEWYTANPGFHEIPAGYGLPWNTPEEEFIPDSLVYESKMALARSQMALQSPDCDEACLELPEPPHGGQRSSESIRDDRVLVAQAMEELPSAIDEFERIGPDQGPAIISNGETIAPGRSILTDDSSRLAITDGICATPGVRPPCVPYHGPVMTHTKIYRGTDPDVVQALKSYVYFREDKRFGGWQSYLQRSDEFVRFCCHMHISEMLSARGGSRKTRVVWRWPDSR